MIKVGSVVFNNCLLCEDIRQEKSNKYILIGVYSGDILIANLPASIPLAFYLDGNVTKPGSHKLHLKLSGPGEGSATIQLGLDTKKKNEPIVLPLPRLDVTMECEGVFTVEASDDGHTWTVIIKKQVTNGENLWSLLRPTVSELPSSQSPPDAPAS